METIDNLETLLDQVDTLAQERDRVTLGLILERVSRNCFGPMLLVTGLIAFMPLIGDIPGVPILAGLVVLLVSVQLLIGRHSFWLPKWLLRRSVDQAKLRKGLSWVRRPARWLDRLLKRRLEWFSRGAAVYVIAIACIGIALLTPVMEFVPFSANVAGAALAVFGLALIGRDGLMALIAFGFTACTIGVLVYGMGGY